MSETCNVKKRLIKYFQSNSELERNRALKILTSVDEIVRSQGLRYLHRQNRQRQETKFNPWSIEKCFTNVIGNKPVSIRTSRDSEFFIEVWRESGNKFLPTAKERKCKHHRATKWIIRNVWSTSKRITFPVWHFTTSFLIESSTCWTYKNRLEIELKCLTASPVLLTFREKKTLDI